MKINFTLPDVSCTGGIKTFFEISDILIRRGHRVYITTLGGDTAWVTNKNLPELIMPSDKQKAVADPIFYKWFKKRN